MKEVYLPNWRDVPAPMETSDRQKQSFEITLRWFLGFCQRGRGGVTIQSTRDFVQWATQQKKPQPWQLEQWKKAIRWFFRAAKPTDRNSDR